LQSAGIYLSGLVSGATVKKSRFVDNITIRGCMYVIASEGIVVDSCLFENNAAGTTPCAAMYIWQTPFRLTNSTFTGNTAVDYGAMYIDCRDGVFPFTIDNCLFEENTATDTDAAASAVGGAVFTIMPTGVVKNCTFISNFADRGAGLYVSGTAAGNKLSIENCLFEANEVAGTSSRGGGIYNTAANVEAKNCVFKDNVAGTAGSGFYSVLGTQFYVRDCQFTGGVAGSTSGFGGAAGNYDAGTIGTYENCTFINNRAATSGGAMTNAFGAQTTLKKCTIEANTAQAGAGVFSQNNTTVVKFDSCAIAANTATATSLSSANGGGLCTTSGSSFTIENSLIEVNSADIGGGIYAGDDTFDLGRTVIRNTVIRNNFCNSQAAGLNVSNMHVLLENSLFVLNQNLGAGAGGAISNNASASSNGAPSTSPIKAVNCTFADNFAVIGAGIAQWNDGTAPATLEMQNCILSNNLPSNYEIEDGTPTVSSLGGNLSSDLTLALELIGLNDLLNLDPLFADPSSFDYHLTAGSPCINKGIASGAPATDLEGKPRVGDPDQGAYEFQTSGTHFAPAQVLPLRLMPNPVVDRAVLVIDDNYSGDARVQVVAQNGAVVTSFMANKIAGRWVQTIDVRNLPAGMYSVQVQAGTAFFEGSLVKR